MKRNASLKSLTAILLTATLCLPSLGQDKKDEKKPSDAEMMAAMTEMMKPGENHKFLESAVGKWSYTVKWWMSPDAPPMVSEGTSVARSVMGGRYVITDHTGKMDMPGPDGKMTSMPYNGMAVEGYDNGKKKFVASWIDNMGTGIMNLEGDYDAASKTLTYTGDYVMMPGVKTKFRETIKITDKDHRVYEMFEDRGEKQVKVMEISYTRKG